MNSGAATDPTAQLEALRALGAAQRDPLGWAYVEALARRRAALPEPARRLIDERLVRALHACRRAVEVPQAPPAPAPAESPLAGLLARLARHETAEGAAPAGQRTDLRAVERFRDRWERMGVEQRLAKADAALPANAGPLNSDGLVSRALALMRDVSPAYLQRFVTHVDALMWLESALAVLPARERGASEAPATPARPRPATKAAGSKRTPRGTSRTPRTQG